MDVPLRNAPDNQMETNKVNARPLAAIFFATLMSLAPIVPGGQAQADTIDAGVTAFFDGDYAGARDAWRPLADAGDPVAQFNLGILHDQGKGVPADAEAAFEWYQSAAEQEDAAAAFNIALMYEAGDGVEPDMARAIDWHRTAAEGGDLMAQVRLAEIYEDGLGVEPDAAEAAKWYERAAEQDYSPAMFKIARMYGTGDGVERDLGAATRWNDMAGEALMAEGGTNCSLANAPQVRECRRRTPRR